MMMELSEIRKSFRHKQVLKGVSLTAEEGECVGIPGGNGCGKSTLLSVLAGVRRADGGSFLYGGRDLLKDHRLRGKVLGYVPQEDPLIGELSALDNLRMWHDRETLQKGFAGGVLADLGINAFLKVPVNKMSGGMKKRLSIGCAVAAGPKILLLDEPSAALDLICKEQIYRYFEHFKAQGGIVLLTTHDIRELELCDKCYILKEGVLQPYTYDGNLQRLVESL